MDQRTYVTEQVQLAASLTPEGGQSAGLTFRPLSGVPSLPGSSPLETLAREGTAVKTVLIGYNQHDGTQFAPGSWAKDSRTSRRCCPQPIPPLGQRQWQGLLRSITGGRGQEAPATQRLLNDVYAGSGGGANVTAGDDFWWPAVRLLTDARFACPALSIADTLLGLPPFRPGSGAAPLRRSWGAFSLRFL
eukprot:COSAG01_NODE_17488_length_1147_cov_1.722328_2_plen_190_part_00